MRSRASVASTSAIRLRIAACPSVELPPARAALSAAILRAVASDAVFAGRGLLDHDDAVGLGVFAQLGFGHFEVLAQLGQLVGKLASSVERVAETLLVIRVEKLLGPGIGKLRRNLCRAAGHRNADQVGALKRLDAYA